MYGQCRVVRMCTTFVLIQFRLLEFFFFFSPIVESLGIHLEGKLLGRNEVGEV